MVAKKNEFLSLISGDFDLSKFNESSLETIIESFPYFSTAYILKSKHLKETDSIELESQLRLAAAYSGDRKQLQSHLFNSSITASEKIESSNNTISNEEKIESKEFQDEILEKQIIVEAINSSIIQEIPEEIDSSFSEEFESATETNEISSDKEPSFDTNQSYSFSSWIDHFSDQEKIVNSSSRLASISSTAQNIQKKAEFYNASKMAKLSVQEDDDLVTETLANVYIQQENYSKAIAAFEKLQLKFPEKKIYFAGRIKEVELLSKN